VESESASSWGKRTAAELRSLTEAPESVTEIVAEIVASVRREGDRALNAFTERFDTGGEPAPPLRVGQAEIAQAYDGLDDDIEKGLQQAFDNVVLFARTAVNGTSIDSKGDGVGLHATVREVPVERAAVYVPGGRAPYPSTVVMGVGAARAAGVPEVVVCSPPPVDPVIMAACQLTGVTEIFRMGGAQAIAALAYGTETVPRVDVIVGPGNTYVQEAKRQVSAAVGIDGFAGPSDLMVIVGDDLEDLGAIVLDLQAQAEHGAGTLVVGVSTSGEVCRRLEAQLGEATTGAHIRVRQAPSLDDALELAEAFAPEHLQLIGAGPESLASRVRRAGCLFVGLQAGTAFGDYIVGSNHILPTNGSARFASGLSAVQFTRRFYEVRIKDATALARAAAPIARAEGFELHAQSMEARIGDNRKR
jgi:histidinol dehydrogenase